MAQDRKPPLDTYPTEDEIAQRVYERFLERAWSYGSPDSWRIAESELLERAARRVARGATAPKADWPCRLGR
jgi:hypothetical protein